MNRQELFPTKIQSYVTPIDTSYLPFIKGSGSGFCDVNLPRFFSGWPYFILVLATLLMGSAKVSSDEVPLPQLSAQEKVSASMAPDHTLLELGCSIAKAFKAPETSESCGRLSGATVEGPTASTKKQRNMEIVKKNDLNI